MDNDDDLIDPVLVERFANGNGTIFVGSGISSSAGMPLWGELMTPLRTDLGAEIDPHASYLDIAELYETKYSRSELVRYLKNSLDKPGFQLTKAHELIVSLPVKRIYTTNFDDLLEQASSRQGIRRNVISDATQVAFADTSTLSIVKLHGDLNHETSLVIGSSDFYSYFTRNPSVSDLLKVELQTHTILFLGYSFSDVNLNMILGKVADHSGAVRPLLYALQLQPKPLATLALDRRGVKVIDIDAAPGTPEAHKKIESWLRRFKKQLQQHERRSGRTDANTQMLEKSIGFPRGQLSRVRPGLHQKFDKGIHSDFRVIVVKGEPGVGKSHLLGAIMQEDGSTGPRNSAGDAFEKIVWLTPSPDPQAASYTLDDIFDAITNSLDSFLLAEKKFSKRHRIDRMLQEHKVLIVIEDLELVSDDTHSREIKDWLQHSGPFARPASRIVITSRTLLIPGFVIELQRLAPHESRIMLDELAKQIMLRRSFPDGANGLKDRIVACTFGNPQAMKMALGLLYGVGHEAAGDAIRDLTIMIRTGARLPVSEDPGTWTLQDLPKYFCIAIEPIFDAINTMALCALAHFWHPHAPAILTGLTWEAELAASTRRLPDAFNILKAMLVFPDNEAVPAQLLEVAANIAGPGKFNSAIQQCVRFGLLECDAQRNEYRIDRISRGLLASRLSVEAEYAVRLAQHFLAFLRDKDVICRAEILAPYWNALVRSEMAKIDPYWPIIRHVVRNLGASALTIDFVELLVHYMDSRFMHTERKELIYAALQSLQASAVPGNNLRQALLRIDALAWTFMQEENFFAANKAVDEGLELLGKADFELIAIANTWKARIACSDREAAKGEPSMYIELAKKALHACTPQPSWIAMRVEMIEGDTLLSRFPGKALEHYEKAEDLAESYGGEGDGYQTGPRIALALLKKWDDATLVWSKARATHADVQHSCSCPDTYVEETPTRDELMRDAEFQFRKLLRNEHIAAARLYGRYGLALISARKHASHEAIIQLRSIHREISQRNKGNVLLKLAEDLYKQTVTNGGTSTLQ